MYFFHLAASFCPKKLAFARVRGLQPQPPIRNVTVDAQQRYD